MPPTNLNPAARQPTVEVKKIMKAPSNNKYNLGHYPWDAYQDNLVVNSAENVRPKGQRQLVGIEHYNDLLSKAGPYKQITYDFYQYKTYGKTPEDMAKSEEEDKEEIKLERQPQVQYGAQPKPPIDYRDRIYHANTRNPAVCLAVIRIAQHNLPFMEFASSLNHLPNQPPDTPLPKLLPNVFVADIPHQGRDIDLDINMALLPYFYHDERHALGFFVLSPDPRPEYSARMWTQTCLFTPCSVLDLMRLNMAEWRPDSIRRDDVHNIQAVGSRDGKWLDPEVDVANWTVCWRVASKIWEKRMKLCRGGEEDPSCAD